MTIKQAAEALRDGKRYRKGNAEVEHRERQSIYYLHRNPIAIVKCGNLILNNCGWATHTTHNHMKHILRAFNIPLGISIKETPYEDLVIDLHTKKGGSTL